MPGNESTMAIDARGIVYLGTERYLAGVACRGHVTSWIPGASGQVASLDALVALWEAFRADPRYVAVTNPERGSASPLADAQVLGAPNVGAVSRKKLRDVLGRNEKQVARAQRANASRRKCA